MGLFHLYHLHIYYFSLYLHKSKFMRKIVVKEIDRFYSRKKGKNYISEYLIYINIDGINIACRAVLGQKEKSLVVNEFLIEHFNTIPKNTEDLSNYIEEITNYKN